MPFGQIFNQGVRYIKINRFDSGGLDRSDYLEQLTNLNIVYEDLGSIQYNIITTQAQNDYYVFGIETRNQATESVNYSVLDYSFNINTIHTQVNNVDTVTNYTSVTGADILNYFTSSTGQLIWGITPNVPLTISLFASSSSPTGQKVILWRNTTSSLDLSTNNTTISAIYSGSNPIIENDVFYITTSAPIGSNIAISMSIVMDVSLINPATSSLVIFEPEFIDFEYNDYNALFGNAETPQFSTQFMDVDYTSTYDKPVNFDLIISGTADRASIQDSNYSSDAWIDLRYNGVRSTSPDFNQLTTDGGYGLSPNVEQNKTFIAYFDNVEETGPELIDQTAYNIKYLIDTQGNVSNPEPDFPSLYNIIDSFESGKNAVVRLIGNDPLLTSNPNDDALTGLHPITSVGRISSILVTETGSGKPDFARTMSFTDVLGNQLQEDVVDFQGIAGANNEFYMNETSWTTIKFDYNIQNPPNSPIWGQAAQFDQPDGTYVFNSSSAAGNTPVFLNFNVRVYNPSPLSNTIRFRIRNMTTGQLIPYTTVSNTQATVAEYTIQAGGEIRLVPGSPIFQPAVPGPNGLIVKGGTTNPINILSPNTEIALQYQVESASPSQQLVFVNSVGVQLLTDVFWNPYYKITQLYPPGELDVNGENMATSSYWSQGSNEYSGELAIDYNKTTTITASQALTKLWELGRKQTLPTASAAIGFSPIGLPFSQDLNSPAAGDWIRFEYNKDFRLFNITEVGTTVDSGRLYLKLYPAFTSGSIQLNHFVMYRILNDGTYVILDVKKPVSGSGFTGIVQPEYISQELKDNYNNIIQDLTQRRVIS